jgi:hypothetical protein
MANLLNSFFKEITHDNALGCIGILGRAILQFNLTFKSTGSSVRVKRLVY